MRFADRATRDHDLYERSLRRAAYGQFVRQELTQDFLLDRIGFLSELLLKFAMFGSRCSFASRNPGKVLGFEGVLVGHDTARSVGRCDRLILGPSLRKNLVHSIHINWTPLRSSTRCCAGGRRSIRPSQPRSRRILPFGNFRSRKSCGTIRSSTVSILNRKLTCEAPRWMVSSSRRALWKTCDCPGWKLPQQRKADDSQTR